MSQGPSVLSLEPESVWRFFAGISEVPRPSGSEARARAWARSVAEAHGFDAAEDATGNLRIRVPATPGREGAPTIVLQAHLDMVCEKNTGTEHDFERDPIRLVVEEVSEDGKPATIVRADGTTLGADDGLGVAMALAAATDRTVAHGPLELLLTVDEEVGMSGAKHLDPGLVTGRILINLDAGDDDVFVVGGVGGCNSLLVWDLPATPLSEAGPDLPAVPLSGSGAGPEPQDSARTNRIEICSVAVRGLTGGHSGGDIHKNRGNAIETLARVLLSAPGLRISRIDGGSRRNAIPREAVAFVAGPAGTIALLRDAAERNAVELSSEHGESQCAIEVTPAAATLPDGATAVRDATSAGGATATRDGASAGGATAARDATSSDRASAVRDGTSADGANAARDGDRRDPPFLLSAADTARVLSALIALPKGVLGIDLPTSQVETSSSLATIGTAVGPGANGRSGDAPRGAKRRSGEGPREGNRGLTLRVACLSRAFSDVRLQEVLQQIAAVAHLAGATVSTDNLYPGWKPDLDSKLLGLCRSVYRSLFNGEVRTEAVHGGLECGVIGGRVGGMDMIAMGSRVTGAHSPDERAYVRSVGRIWSLLGAVLAELSAQG